MYLTEISSSNLPSFSPFKKHSSKSTSVPNKFDLISRSFDEALLRRLKALLSSPPPSISLAWLSDAVDLLRLVHSDARGLIASVEVTAIDDEYLDDSVKLLDVCNAVTAEIERLRHRRLVLAFAAQLLGEGNVRRAKDVLNKEEKDGGHGRRRVSISAAEALVKDLAASVRASSPPPRGGKINTVGRVVRRTIHAVGLVTVFVAGVMVSSMSEASEAAVVMTVEAPAAEYSWAEALNELAAEVSGELKRRRRGGGGVMMVEEVETRVREACEREGRVENDVVLKEVEKAMVSFSDGLEELSKRVNEMFHGVLCNRNHMLDNVRVKS